MAGIAPVPPELLLVADRRLTSEQLLHQGKQVLQRVEPLVGRQIAVSRRLASRPVAVVRQTREILADAYAVGIDDGFAQRLRA